MNDSRVGDPRYGYYHRDDGWIEFPDDYVPPTAEEQAANAALQDAAYARYMVSIAGNPVSTPEDIEASRQRYAEEQAEIARQQAEARWKSGYEVLKKQMGALQDQTDIYKRRSPLDASTHIDNIATSLARDYGVNTIGDIGVREVIRPGYASGSDESYIWIPEEKVSEYFNKTTGKIIPGYKFASEGRGDGYSDYNLQPVQQADGSTIVLPIQQYSKSGMGSFVENLGPILPVVNLVAMAAGAPPLWMAAGNVALQYGAGNVDNIGDALQVAAPYLVAAGLQELASVGGSGLSGLDVGPTIPVAGSEAGTAFSNLVGNSITGIAADVAGGALSGAVQAGLADGDIGTNILLGGLSPAISAGVKSVFSEFGNAAGLTPDKYTNLATSLIGGIITAEMFKKIVSGEEPYDPAKLATAASTATPALTSTATPALTSTATPALTSTATPALTSTAVPALTSTAVPAITTMDAKGLRSIALPENKYWQQTGAAGTAGRGGVQFFDWSTDPTPTTGGSNLAAAEALSSVPAITTADLFPSNPNQKQYFNQATNRYYTDPTGTWQPPTGWNEVPKPLSGGGIVDDFLSGDVNFFGSGPSYFSGLDLMDYGAGLDLNDLDFSGLNLSGFDSKIPDFSGLDLSSLDVSGVKLNDAEVNDYLMSLPSNNASYGAGLDFSKLSDEEVDQYLRDLPSENASYGGYDRTASYQQDIKDAAKTSGTLSGAAKTVVDKLTGLGAKLGESALKSITENPGKWLAALAGAGLGYAASKNNTVPSRGLKSLGLSQQDVYGTLKGVPIKRAMGGELGGYAGGGGLHYLKSAEDGMADRIPATIDNKQPARLSGGEFVIPADVVSHLGNGNSEAGAKQLYGMMDRIRHARTGTKQQGKKINPAKFTPN